MSETGARRVFPCFDQLGMKATFTIKHRHETILTGLSNNGKKTTKPESNPSPFITDEFEETVRMEASSVAIVLLDFPSEKSTHSKTDIRFFADSRVFKRLRPIITPATQIFQFFSDYFDVPYPIAKLDIISIPHFFSYTETAYGVIFISQKLLSKGIEQTTHSAEYELVSEMCYAVSGQWIGHMVTISNLEDTITHIALNIFLQTQCAIQIEPKWEHNFIEPDIMNSFIKTIELQWKDLHGTFLVTGTSPLYLESNPVRNLKKTFHLMRMIHFFLGHDMFRKSIHNYLEEFKFSNTNFNDLWITFTNTANTMQPHLLPNISVSEIITSWMYQEGYPLINVTWKPETKEISISQVPFNFFEAETSRKYKKRCWLMPLSYTTKTESKLEINKNFREWLTCKGLHLKIELKEDEWFLLDLNVNVLGRVNYDEAIWIAIQKSLVNNEDPQVFDAFTRARLVSDMFILAEIGNLSYTIVLDAMKYLSRENQYNIWTLALREFDKIRLLLLRSNVYKSFEEYVRGLLDSLFQRINYQNLIRIAAEDSKLEIAITDSSCNYGVVACRQKSLELNKKWTLGEEKLDSVPSTLRKIILCQAIKYGNRKAWDFVWNLFEQETNTISRENYLQALSCSTSTKMIKRLLNRIKDEEKVTRGESFHAFRSLLSSNRKANKLARSFFMDNFNRIPLLIDTLKYRLFRLDLTTEHRHLEQHNKLHTCVMVLQNLRLIGTNDRKYNGVYRYLMDLFETTARKKDLNQLLEFAKLHELMEIRIDILHESRTMAERNVAWLQKNENVLNNYFRNNNPRKRWIFR